MAVALVALGLLVVFVGATLYIKLEHIERKIMSEIDQVLAADTATLTAVQGVATQLTTDVNTLIGLIQNGDPAALAAAQALGTNLSTLQTALQNLDTSAQGAGGQSPTANAQPAAGSAKIPGSSGTVS
jgi:hypothetical protein